MDTKKRIAQLDDEHLAFRRKASELEWDYHDMKREARNFSEEMSNLDYIILSSQFAF